MSSQGNYNDYVQEEMSSPIHVPELITDQEGKGCLISIDIQDQPKQNVGFLPLFTIRPKRKVKMPERPYILKPFESFLATEDVVQQLHLIFSDRAKRNQK